MLVFMGNIFPLHFIYPEFFPQVFCLTLNNHSSSCCTCVIKIKHKNVSTRRKLLQTWMPLLMDQLIDHELSLTWPFCQDCSFQHIWKGPTKKSMEYPKYGWKLLTLYTAVILKQTWAQK
uniref:Uncharacterized protein n=1 Tax=Micrurus spixii TaxID=129469 RepID=A0A2D4M8F2_9SAUR